MKVIDKEELHRVFTKFKLYKQEGIFNELYTKYSDLVYKIAFSLIKNKENSEDIKQIVFEKIWKMNQENLPTKSEASWLYTLTKNETLNYMRKQENSISLDELYYINSEDEELNKLIDIDSYNRLISRLNKKEQEILSLKVLANLSFKEIAQILNEPISTIQWRYYKSVHTLKILLSNLSMFIVTITSFVIYKKINTKKEANIAIEQDKNEQSSEQTSVSNKEQSEMQNQINNGNIFQENNDIIENIIVDTNTIISNTKKTDISFFCVAVFFLITTIIFLIFFIKSQQKSKKKVSK